MRKDEEAVHNANKSLQKRNSVPWDTDLTILRSLESGLLVSEKLQEDFLAVGKSGKQKLKVFFSGKNPIKCKENL